MQNRSIFTSFSHNFFWQFFSLNQSCQQLKSPKPQHFHEFFTQKDRQFSREIKVVNSQKVQNHNIFTNFSPKKIDIFLGKSKLNIWTKNEDFEQCDQEAFWMEVSYKKSSALCKSYPNFQASSSDMVWKVSDVDIEKRPSSSLCKSGYGS